jgi:hypothetical protein
VAGFVFLTDWFYVAQQWRVLFLTDWLCRTAVAGFHHVPIIEYYFDDQITEDNTTGAGRNKKYIQSLF